MPTKPDTRSCAKILESISRGQRQPDEIFSAFCKLAACALSCEQREEEYLAEARRWPKEALEAFSHALAALIRDMEGQPFHDLLGDTHMEVLGTRGQQWNGEFYTPHGISDMIARMTIDADTLPKEGTISVCEPACGSGRMILSVAKCVPPGDVCRLRVMAIDVNARACDMTFINTTLWAIPTVVLHGNALSAEVWHRYVNMPMRLWEPRWRDLYHGIGEMVPAPKPRTIDAALQRLADLRKQAA